MASRTTTPGMHLPVGGVLTPRGERWIRAGSVGSAVVIAACAMVLSYAGLLDLALKAKVSPHLALLVPVMVDGLQFVGSLGVVYSTLSGLKSWYPWALMGMGVTISAWGNWQAAPDVATAKLLHAAAPVILALVLEELLRVMRHKVALRTEWEAQETPAVEDPFAGSAPPGAPGADLTVASAAAAPASRAPEAAAPASLASPAPVSAAATPGQSEGQVEVHPGNPDAVVEGEGFTADAAAADPTAAGAAAERVQDTSPAAGESSAAEPVPAVEATWSPREIVLPLSVTKAATATAHPTEYAEPTAPGEDDISDSGEDSGEDVLPPYPADASFPDQVKAILTADPEISAATIARVMGKDGSYTRKTVRKVRALIDEQRADGTTVAALPQPVSEQVPEPVSEGPAQTETTAAPAPDSEWSDGDPFTDPFTDPFPVADPFAVSTPRYVSNG